MYPIHRAKKQLRQTAMGRKQKQGGLFCAAGSGFYVGGKPVCIVMRCESGLFYFML